MDPDDFKPAHWAEGTDDSAPAPDRPRRIIRRAGETSATTGARRPLRAPARPTIPDQPPRGRPAPKLDRKQSSIATRLVGVAARKASIAKMGEACEREIRREVLKALAAGMTKAHIARCLGVSAPRVSQYVTESEAKDNG